MATVIRSMILRTIICSVIITSLMVSICISTEVESLIKRQVSSFEKGRIRTTDSKKIFFSKIDLADTVFVYQPKKSKEINSISASRVISIEVETGSYAEEGVFLGAALGAVLGWLSYEHNKSYREDMMGKETQWNSSNTAVTVGYMVGWAFIGGLTGHKSKKYTTVYPKPKFKLKGSFKKSVSGS